MPVEAGSTAHKDVGHLCISSHTSVLLFITARYGLKKGQTRS